MVNWSPIYVLEFYFRWGSKGKARADGVEGLLCNSDGNALVVFSEQVGI